MPAMPVLFINPFSNERRRAHWWLLPSFHSYACLLHTSAPLCLLTGSTLSLLPALSLASAAARPSAPSASPSASTSSSSPSPSTAPPAVSSRDREAGSPAAAGKSRNMFVAGIVSGLVVAGLFNPWDRALYLSVLHERPFLDRDNFLMPYKGFFQALFLRTLSSGLYFPLFDLFTPVYVRLFERYHTWRYPTMSATAASQCAHPLGVHFLAGNTAGAVSGVVLNQLTAIKYASWDAEHGFLSTAQRMWREGGIRPFMKGIVPTVLRDTIFGGVFALTKEGCARGIRSVQRRARRVSREEKEHSAASSSAVTAASLVQSVSAFTMHNTKTVDFVSSLLAGAAGTIASSPFNYVRNIKYGWPASDTPPSALRILSDLGGECGQRTREGGWGQGAMHLQDRLRIGWGTARVAVGMAVGYEIYELVKHGLDDGNLNALAKLQ